MAETNPDAQDTVLCEECEEGPAQHFCQNCKGRLCNSCKDAHKRKRIFKSHVVLPLKWDTPIYGKCHIHETHTYEMSCVECQIPICSECIKTFHNGHKVEDIMIAYERVKQQVLEKVKNFDVRIAEQNKSLSQSKKRLSEMREQKMNVQREMKAQANRFIDQVQKILAINLKRSNDNFEKNEKRISDYENKIQQYIDNCTADRNVLDTKSKLKTVTDLILFWNRTSQNQNLKACTPDEPMQLCANFRFFSGDLDESLNQLQFGYAVNNKTLLQIPKSTMSPMVATKRKTLKEVPTAMTEINCNEQILYFLHTLSPMSFLISGKNSKIREIDIHGNQIRTLESISGSGHPTSLAVTIDGNILYCDKIGKRVMTILMPVGNPTVLFETEWYPEKVVVSKYGHIITLQRDLWKINVFKRKQTGKIVRHDSSGTVLHEIQKENNTDKNLFTLPWSAAENINLDICVSDGVEKKVFIVTSTGIYRCRYDGQLSLETSDPNFYPTEVATDSLGNILISDRRNHNIHLIDINGKFVRILLSAVDGLQNPNPISIDHEDKLWVGKDGGVVKVFQYLEIKEK